MNNFNGTSACPAGKENFETFMRRRQQYFMYDYRFPNGTLVSCVKKTLKECREYRDKYAEKYPERCYE